ncbi:MAG: hypothetical protein ABI741_06555 [Ferruginibacter sp.]
MRMLFLHLKTAFIFLLIFITASSLYCQPQNKSIKEYLNPDGTLQLNRGFNGTLNAAGYTMGYQTNGAPFFQPASAGDEKWDSTFNTPGVNGVVYAVLINGNDVYFGGVFTKAGGIAANHIAKWNASGWSALGTGVNLRVNGLLFIGTDLYAAGNEGVSKWNGSTWTIIGTVADPQQGNLYAGSLAKDASNNLYVTGAFGSINGVIANSVAKWNGISWTALGTGLQNPNGEYLTDVEVLGTDVYVSGGFEHMGSVAAKNVAKWNGTAWSALSSGLEGTGSAYIAVAGGYLYATGEFDLAGAVPVNNAARWNGTSWSALGNGLNNDPVESLFSDGTNIYVSGGFDMAGTVPADGIAKWDGTTWSAVPRTGLTFDGKFITAMAVAPGKFFLGGSTDLNAPLDMHNIASWNGSSWQVIGNGMGDANTDFINCVTVDGTDVYVGGNFVRAGGVLANGIAKWDGNKWSALGAGFFGQVYDIAVIGTKVFASGAFGSSAGVSIPYIAVWDGTIWDTVGTGMNGKVWALEVYNNELYAGGEFTTAGGISARGIAKWNGTAWNAFGNGFNNTVRDIKIATNGTVYACGDFTFAGTVPAARVAKWNGTAWSAVGDGFQATTVHCLALSPTGELYAGGGFIVTGNGVLVNSISRFNGTSWQPMGTGMSTNARIYNITFNGTDMYVAGTFTTAGGIIANNLARWDGSSWSAVGSGLDKDPTGYATVMGLVIVEEKLMLGGYFSYAGGRRADKFVSYAISSQAGINHTLCANGNTVITSNITGSSYQWQANSGSGFANIADNVNYAGTNTSSLQLTNIPTSSYGYQYRCSVNTDVSSIYLLNFSNTWTGTVNSFWSTPGNWSCGTVPDANTNVTINSGPVIVTVNGTCRTLRLAPGISFTVNSGISFIITH